MQRPPGLFSCFFLPLFLCLPSLLFLHPLPSILSLFFSLPSPSQHLPLLQVYEPKVVAPGHLPYMLSWFKYSHSLLELSSKGWGKKSDWSSLSQVLTPAPVSHSQRGGVQRKVMWAGRTPHIHPLHRCSALHPQWKVRHWGSHS